MVWPSVEDRSTKVALRRVLPCSMARSDWEEPRSPALPHEDGLGRTRVPRAEPHSHPLKDGVLAPDGLYGTGEEGVEEAQQSGEDVACEGNTVQQLACSVLWR